MSDAEQKLAEDRDNRRAARGLFDNRLARVKADLSARSVGGRIKDEAQEKAFDALDQAIDVAKESKGIIAATVGALALWAFRAPLLRAVRRLRGQGPVQDQPGSAEGETPEESDA